MLNILHIIPTLDIGGVEMQLAELVKRLNREKYNITVCCITRGGPLEESIRGSGVKLVILKRRFKFDLSIIFQLIRLMKREKIDLVHTYLFTANAWGRVAAILANVPVVIASERNAIPERKKSVHILIDRFLSRYTDVIVCNSNFIKELNTKRESINGNKFTIVHNAVDTKQFSPEINSDIARKEFSIYPDVSVVGMVARLHICKGHQYLLKAAVEVIKVLPEVKFVLVGDGELRGELENSAMKLGIEKNIVFTGSRQDVSQLIQLFDVAVLSSIYEGFGNFLIEAMAMTKPVVATNVGGIPEVVKHEETGILVSPRNPEALAEGIIRLLKNKEEVRRMGLAGRKRVEQYYDINLKVKKVEEIYVRNLRNFKYKV